MKKVLYSLLIFISIFFVVDKVSAKIDNTNTIYYNLENSSFISLYNSLKPKLDEIVAYYKSNNPYNHQMVIYLNHSTIHVNLLPSAFDSSVGSNYCFYNNLNRSSDVYVSMGCYAPSYNVKVYSFQSGSDISQFKSDMQTEFSSLSGLTANNTSGTALKPYARFTNNVYDFFSGNSYVRLPYYSTVPIYNNSSSSSNTYHKIKIGERELSVDGYLKPSENYFAPENDVYTLSNLEYSAIEIKFNINDFPMIDEGNDINLYYDIKLDTDMIIPLLPIPQEKVYRSMSLGDYPIGTTMNLLFDEKANNYVYEGTKHYDYWNTITYRFEFPFTNDYVGNITLEFWSDSNYTITLEERSNEENDIKYTELDLTGKYGVGFIPKVSSFDIYNEFYGVFKVPYQNNYRLMFYKDYSYVSQNNKNNLILDKVLLTFENFEYKFTKENKNSYLLFINNNYESGSEASILYNSNYFNYCILDEELSSCDIVNPNTDENVTINPNLGDLDSFGVKDILHSFKTFSNSTNFILENVTNFYNNFLPDELKIFFFISFGFAVIIMITKIVL